MLGEARAQAGRGRRRRDRLGRDARPRRRPRRWSRASAAGPAARSSTAASVLKEFDLDEALARRPRLLLLDELAHTNAPGSRHAKRWQDVEELLDAGIDVWTTLNVQHLESLNDLVARITDVSMRETVPDRLLERRGRGRVHRPAAGRAAGAPARGQGLRAGAGAARDARLLPQGEPGRPARAGAAPHGRPRGRGRPRLPAPPRDRADLAGGGAAAGLHPAQSRERPPDPRGAAGGHAPARGLDRRVRGEPLAARAVGGRARVAGRGVQAGRGAGRGHHGALGRGGAGPARLRAPAQRERRGGRQAQPLRMARAPAAAVPSTRSCGSVRRDRRVRDLERARGGGAPSPGRSAPSRAALRLRVGRAGGPHVQPDCLDHAPAVRQEQPDHGLPAGRGLRGHALRPVALRAGRRAERRRLRLLLRVALPHLRGERHPVPRHVRRDADRGPAHQHARGARARPGRARAPAGAAHAPALHGRAASWRAVRTPEAIAAAATRQVADVFHGPVQVLLPDAESRLRPVPAETPVFPADARERAVADWAYDTCPARGRGDRHPAGRGRALPAAAERRAEPLGVLGVRAAPPTCCPSRRTSSTCWRRWPARSRRRCKRRACPSRPSRRASKSSASACAARS